jgi:VanZ family protein
MAMLFAFSSMSKPPTPPSALAGYDVHMAAYAGLGVITARATGRGWRNVSGRAVLGAVVIASAYGVSDEYHQLFVSGRSFDVLDMVADAIGAAVGASGVWAWSIIRRRF